MNTRHEDEQPVLLMGLRDIKITPEQMSQVQRMASNYRVVKTLDRDDVVGYLPHIEIVVGDFPRDLLAEAPNLRWWQQWYAGVDWLLEYPEATELAFTLTNVSGLHAIPITEHIFAMLLAFARDLPAVIRAQERNEWIGHGRDDVFELAGKTMALIGVGGIGSHTVDVARALGMDVIAVRRRASQPVAGAKRTVGIADLLDVLPQADFIVSTLPLTLDTRRIIDETTLRAMKPSAYFVNIGRGSTVDEDALVRALEEGWIAGAGLDVFVSEPLSPESPLWAMENVIVSPHFAGQTPHYDDRAYEMFLDNLERYLDGQSLARVVDKRLGY